MTVPWPQVAYRHYRNRPEINDLEGGFPVCDAPHGSDSRVTESLLVEPHVGKFARIQRNPLSAADLHLGAFDHKKQLGDVRPKDFRPSTAAFRYRIGGIYNGRSLAGLRIAMRLGGKCKNRPSSALLAATACGVTLLLFGLPSFAQDQASRLPKKPDSESRTMEVRVTKTIKLEHRAGGCKANLQLEYWQKGDVAEVETTLTNPECGASSGEYTLQVRYRGDDGEMTTDEYPETWVREDSEPILTTKQYRIGNDVDLVRVRSRNLSCECQDTDSAHE